MSTAVAQLMTIPVVTVRRDTPFKEVAARIRAARVSAVPVIDDRGKVIGTVSAGDLLASRSRLGRNPVLRGRRGGWARAVHAGMMMTSPAVTIRSSAAAGDAERLMRRHRIPSLPVVDHAGRLIGIVSRGDVLGRLVRPDLAIRREIILEVILRDFALDPHALSVVVSEGVVTLRGDAESDAVGRYLAEAVSSVDGVVAVRNQLSHSHQQDSRRAGTASWLWAVLWQTRLSG
jgi:CBS-domain-containing membrane protein